MKKVKVELNHQAIREQLLKSKKLDRKMRREHRFLRGYEFKGAIPTAETRKVIKYSLGGNGKKLSPNERAKAVMRKSKKSKNTKQQGYARYLFHKANENND